MNKAQKPEELIGSLIVAKALVSKYRRALDMERTPLELIMENLFPYLENILITQMKKNDPYSAKICEIILSILCMAAWMQFPLYLTSDKLRVWMVAVKTLLMREIPPELTNKLTNWDEIMKRSQEPEWKVKANCMKLVSRYHPITKIDLPLQRNS